LGLSKDKMEICDKCGKTIPRTTETILAIVIEDEIYCPECYLGYVENGYEEYEK